MLLCFYRYKEGNMTEEKASRFNAGKVDHTRHYVPALEAMARVWAKGAEKYPDQEDGSPNWHKLWGDETLKVVGASALRHMFALMSGEERDEETGEYHAAHCLCNMSMLIKWYEDNSAKNTPELEKEWLMKRRADSMNVLIEACKQRSEKPIRIHPDCGSYITSLEEICEEEVDGNK